MNYEEAVSYVFNIPRFNDRGKTGNDNLKSVMELLDNPQDKIKSIHIAGTNGKGSTAAFIKCILSNASYKVGVFTSPHLIKVNERIIISENNNEQMITDEEFVSCFSIVQKAVEESIEMGCAHISFFEYMFAIAAVYFETKALDFVIYETGLGGRLDATNIITPLVSVIASIGLDHVKYLGNTINEIAFEKAGIIKPGIPVVFNTGNAKADEVIEKQAKGLLSTAISVAKSDYIINDLSDKTIDFSLHNSYYSYDNLKLNTEAIYQLDNAVLAIYACGIVAEAVNSKVRIMAYDNIRDGVSNFAWAGRMERVNEHVLLDGAHNLNAIIRFTEAIKTFHKDEEISILFAASNDKDYDDMIRHICEQLKLKKIYVTMLNSDRAIDSKLVADIFSKYTTTKVVSDDNCGELFKIAYSEAVKDDSLLVCVGSLYLIGNIKEMILNM